MFYCDLAICELLVFGFTVKMFHASNFLKCFKIKDLSLFNIGCDDQYWIFNQTFATYIRKMNLL